MARNEQEGYLELPPRVAVWNHTWLPASETFIRDHVESLDRWQPLPMGWHRVVGGIYEGAVSAPYAPTAAGRVLRKLSGRLVGRILFVRQIRRSSTKLIHAHFGGGGIDAVPFAKASGIPLIVTFHGKDVTAAHHKPRIEARYRRRLESVFCYATKLIAVSDFIADRLEEMGAPKSKIVVQHLGIPLRKPGAGLGRRTEILFVGRLVEKKGVADLLTALSLLPERHRSVRLRVIGFGPLLDELKLQAAELGVNADFQGRMSSEQVALAMAEAMVFAAPSKTASNGDAEGFGLVFLEAAAQGLPIVSYFHGGVPEAVEHARNGLLAPEGDVNLLAANIQTLLDDQDLRGSFSRHGSERVANEFNISKLSAELEKMYDAVAEAHKKEPARRQARFSRTRA